MTKGGDRSALDGLGTEGVNPRASKLEGLGTIDLLRLMNDEDRRVADAVAAAIPAIAATVDLGAARLAAGGRLHSFGAGTSGRLALLDAAECPPTFGVSADRVQGHLAGGSDAMVRAREGVEDDPEEGSRDVDRARIAAGDLVIALTASGRTPYCAGVLERAREIGAATVLISSNRDPVLGPAAETVIVAETGPELLAGSTRLKAGTAQKLILNMISTGIMIRLGRTFGPLMVAVQPTNAKLRRRAERLIETITGRQEGIGAVLDQAGGSVRSACLMLMRGWTADVAQRRLEAAGGSLAQALAGPD